VLRHAGVTLRGFLQEEAEWNTLLESGGQLPEGAAQAPADVGAAAGEPSGDNCAHSEGDAADCVAALIGGGSGCVEPSTAGMAQHNSHHLEAAKDANWVLESAHACGVVEWPIENTRDDESGTNAGCGSRDGALPGIL
jgi:hypothetical protein